MNNDRYLLLDTALWAQADHLKLTLGLARKASEKNSLFGEELPWEVRYDNLYAKVIFDRTDNLYKCWYNPFIIDVATTDTPPVQRERGAYRAALAKADEAGRQIRKHRGLVRAALADVDGKGLADSIPIQADVTDLPMQWRDGQDLAALVGREIQIFFELQDATLYSFSFSD